MAYPVAYQADYKEHQSRLTTFFRLIVAIPWLIVSYFWALVGAIGIIVGWFAIVFTGRYPDGLYNLTAMSLRFHARVYSWMYLLTDVWPPFDGAEHPEYPIRLVIPAPQESYSRVKTLFRIIIGIPVMVMLWLFSILYQIVGVLLWVVIVITGKNPKGLFDVQKMALAYYALGGAYLGLVTETYPPISPEDDGTPSYPASPSTPPPPTTPSPFGS
ncbi:DUF4389 domain-containing protein [Conexibacter sp. CPCC 206217]|uniref:DUF4389 domain-containing protein n=1 Tax=Conexibacter sp. CPCC 206217 TaxID=3064574 RepID=UPI00271C5612|nr:DUF4389 domain-containing protein [Conexibacter sp. CPCC 206217]MDO8214044.1 DUF4389 domain-containing protein [Conexibacter sp. CPCC 206217]